MWLLRNDEKGLIYRVTAGKQHVVSRKEGELMLIGDNSISRKHAQIFVDDENVNNGIVLKDLGSKYGTFVIIGNGELTQVPPNEPKSLKSGDSVRFGIQWNLWRAEFVPLLVATSTLTPEEKKSVSEMVGQLGGQVVNNWSDTCTHLTMNKLTVTVKVVCALAAGQPIVRPDYWTSLIQSFSSLQSTLPNCKDHLPPLAEAMLNPSEVSFEPNPARSKLFIGYTFVASSPKQLNRIKAMISAAGGTAVEYSARSWTEDELLKDKVLLMQHLGNDKPGSQQSQVSEGYIPVARKLRSQGVRCIPESEVGLSILHCSVVQYCNPRFSPQSLLSNSSSLPATQPVTIICPNTEEYTATSSHSGQTIDYPGPSNVHHRPNKRGHEDLSDDEQQSRKQSERKENSEDLFDSQSSQHSNVSKTPKMLRLESKNSVSSKDEPSSSKENVQSLDIFAPSGERSRPTNPNQSQIRPSCEDIFGSAVSKNQQSKKLETNENNNISKYQENSFDIKDEFSLVSKKRSRVGQAKSSDKDDFSLVSNKRSKKDSEVNPEQKDEVFFISNKKSSKRPRQSNPDIFETSPASSINNSFTSVAGPSKPTERDEFSYPESKKKCSKEVLFTVPAEPVPKKRQNKEGLLNVDKPDSDIKIGWFSDLDESSAGPSSVPTDGSQNNPQQGLPIYSKLIPTADTINQEIEEEIDDLERKFVNTTIVIVKPLIAKREKALDTSSNSSSGKNFKKFRKVVPINKRAVPHIIGGSDLIPHKNMDQALDEDELDLVPALQRQASHDSFYFK